MTDTTAKIRSKGLDATGVTEEIASQMHACKGKHYMAIVELRVDETHDKADGKHKVDLILTQVEPALDEQLEEHLRELTRVLYFNRQAAKGTQATIDDLNEDGKAGTTVAQTVAVGQRFEPHDHLPVDPANPDDPDQCDVCGDQKAAAVHTDRDTLGDPFTVPAEED